MIETDRRKSAVAAAAICSIVCLAIRLIWVAFAAQNVPFFDQWDMVARLFPDYLNGNLTFYHFIEPANEHRIIYTRLIDLFSFAIHGNQAESYFSIQLQQVFQAISCGLLVFIINRQSFDLLRTTLLVLLFCTPLSWENFYWAYQSQVYITILLTLCSLWIISRPSFNPWVICLLTLIGLPNQANTMWIPLLASAASLFYFYKLDRARIRIYWSIGLLLIAIAVYKLIPFNPTHAHLKAKSIVEFFLGLKAFLKWPYRQSYFLIWAPFLILSYQIFKQPYHRLRGFTFLLFSWLLCLYIAASYGRHGAIPNRYFDYLAFGLIAVIFFSRTLDSANYKYPWGKIFATIFFAYHLQIIPDSIETSYWWKSRIALGDKIVRCGLKVARDNPKYLREYLSRFPPLTYPSNERLADILGSQSVQNILTFMRPCENPNFEPDVDL